METINLYPHQRVVVRIGERIRGKGTGGGWRWTWSLATVLRANRKSAVVKLDSPGIVRRIPAHRIADIKDRPWRHTNA